MENQRYILKINHNNNEIRIFDSKKNKYISFHKLVIFLNKLSETFDYLKKAFNIELELDF